MILLPSVGIITPLGLFLSFVLCHVVVLTLDLAPPSNPPVRTECVLLILTMQWRRTVTGMVGPARKDPFSNITVVFKLAGALVSLIPPAGCRKK